MVVFNTRPLTEEFYIQNVLTIYWLELASDQTDLRLVPDEVYTTRNNNTNIIKQWWILRDNTSLSFWFYLEVR